jgi:hypothetical protein
METNIPEPDSASKTCEAADWASCKHGGQGAKGEKGEGDSPTLTADLSRSPANDTLRHHKELGSGEGRDAAFHLRSTCNLGGGSEGCPPCQLEVWEGLGLQVPWPSRLHAQLPE